MATQAPQHVYITPPNIKEAAFQIESKSPLICHRFDQKARLSLLTSGGNKRAPKQAIDPDDDYRRSLYVMEDGRYGFPAAGFKAAMVRAAKHIHGLSMTDARGMFFIIADGRDDLGTDLVAITGEPKRRDDHVRVGQGTSMRYRGEFAQWTAILRVSHDADLIGADSIGSLIARAGMTVGIGDWRPEKNGSFGLFNLTTGEG